MNYKHIYDQLCSRSQSRIWAKFTYEKHHIIPKSMGGSDKKSNIAILTPREHALAHLLLVKFLTGKHKAQMVFALKTMISYRNKHRDQLTTRQYEALRKSFQIESQTPEYSSWRSEITKAQWTPERRAQVAEKTRQQWVTGPKRESFGSEQYKLKKSQQMKERWQDPEYQQEQSQRTAEAWNKDGYLRKSRNGRKKALALHEGRSNTTEWSVTALD
jgi:hypothetical protein